MVNCRYCDFEITCEHCIKWPPKNTCDYCRELIGKGAEESQIGELAKKERELTKYYKYMQVLEAFFNDTSFEEVKLIREEVEGMSKREIEETAFAKGVYAVIDTLLHTADPEMIKEAAMNVLDDLNKIRKQRGQEPINIDNFDDMPSAEKKG